MNRQVLTNALLLDPEAPEPVPGKLLVESGRIEDVLPAEAPTPEGAERIDLAGRQIAPGFLDLHDHSGLIFAQPDGLHDALHDAASACVRHGTTGFLPTSVAWPAERLHAFVTQMEAVMTQWDGKAATPLGLHLEGPWINPDAAGAQPGAGIRGYDRAEGRELLAIGEGLVRLVTLAPEAENADALLDALAQRGIVAALGHSLASPELIDRAADEGMTHVTHLFNAMGPMRHREPGVPGHVLCEDRLTCDLICDGAHVHPRMVRLAARALGERLVLITDHIDATAPGADFGSGGVRQDGQALRLADGRLAGSCLRLDLAVRNAVAFEAASLLEAVAACTLRPARVLGIEAERGTLRRGARADLAVLDDQANVVETWIEGERVWAAESA